MDHFFDWRDFEGSQADKFFKATLWQGNNLMLGLNCLEPGQSQKVHSHVGTDKFYLVLAGRGSFTVGDQQKEATQGSIIVAPAEVPHGVSNSSDERLTLLVGIAPPIK